MEKVRDIVKIVLLKASALLLDYESVQMVESHNFCVSKLSEKFTLLGSCKACDNEFFCLDGKPLFGTQFHPEKS